MIEDTRTIKSPQGTGPGVSYGMRGAGPSGTPGTVQPTPARATGWLCGWQLLFFYFRPPATGLLRSSLKENNEVGLPMFTENPFHVGTGKYSRLCALFPPSWAPLLFLLGWKQLLKEGRFQVTATMKCSVAPNPLLTILKNKIPFGNGKILTYSLGVGRIGNGLSRTVREPSTEMILCFKLKKTGSFK